LPGLMDSFDAGRVGLPLHATPPLFVVRGVLSCLRVLFSLGSAFLPRTLAPVRNTWPSRHLIRASGLPWIGEFEVAILRLLSFPG